MPAAAFDPSDPAVRAGARVRDRERAERVRRTGGGLALGAVALVAPFVAAPLTGDGGATVGAVVGSLLLLGCAVAVWPWEWSPEERRHHELMAIWSEARGVEGGPVPWDRYAAWADAEDERIALSLLCRRGSTDAPTPVTKEDVRRIDAEDMAGAAAAMEGLREEAAAREAGAREKYFEGISAAERRAHEEALRRVEAAAEEEQRLAEEAMRRELAEEEAAERRAQAEAVARALRRR